MRQTCKSKWTPKQLKEKIAKNLDMYIGIYYTSQEARENFTLGEFLIDTLPAVAPDYYEEFLATCRGNCFKN